MPYNWSRNIPVHTSTAVPACGWMAVKNCQLSLATNLGGTDAVIPISDEMTPIHDLVLAKHVHTTCPKHSHVGLIPDDIIFQLSRLVQGKKHPTSHH